METVQSIGVSKGVGIDKLTIHTEEIDFNKELINIDNFTSAVEVRRYVNESN